MTRTLIFTRNFPLARRLRLAHKTSPSMKKLPILFLLLLPLFASAQSRSKFARTNTDTLPDNFKLSSARLREHIYNGIPAKLIKDLNPRTCFRFADQSAVQLSTLFSSGQVYSDWPMFEDYLNRVVARIMPKELAQDSVIHAYLVKDGSFNAFMTPSGILFVHVGLFDEIPTESALAGILTHELAHYYLRHSLNRYVKQEKGEFERVFNKSSASKFSVQNEMQADSLAIAWMDQSGYGFQGINEGIKAIQRLEKRMLLKLEDIWELPETTHPGSERRLAQIDSFARHHPGTAGADFIVSKEQFYTFREFSKSETLRHLLYNFAYDACIEKAFKYHLLNPNRSEYIYYLMEAIRRKCYFNVDFWKKKFITDQFYKVVETKTGRRKVKLEGNIFKENSQEIIGLTDEEKQNLPTQFYWEGVEKFETYEEAFDFFSQVGDLLKDPECMLSNALSLNSNPEARNKLLTQYLAFPKVRFREYATHLLDGTVQTALPDKTLTALSDFYATVRQGKEEIFIRGEKLTDDNNLTPILEKAVAGFDRRRYLNLSELQNKNINDYILLLELKKLSLLQLVAKGEKTQLHILDPRYWEIMNKFQVNELEFIDFIYYDARKSETTMEAYKEIIESDVNALLSEVKRNRYLETRIAAIRLMPKSNMKVMHYGPEVKVDYNKPAGDEIALYINDNLKAKDKEAKQFDGKQE